MADIHIDPIVVREMRERLSTVLLDIKTGQDAADALLWFTRRMKAGAKPMNMFSLSAVTNGDDEGTRAAGQLLNAAAQQFYEPIMQRAVEIAQAQLKAAEKARKEGAR